MLLLAFAALERPVHADPNPYLATTLDATGAVVSVSGIVVGVDLLDSPTYYYASIPVLLASAGALVVLPSAGHIYAGEFGSTGMELRAIGLGASAVGGIILGLECIHPSGAVGGTCLIGVGGLVVSAGIATIVTGLVWDLATAHSAGEDPASMSMKSQSPSPEAHIWSIGGSF